SGEATEKTRTVNQFISILKEKTALPIIPWEERFSTVSAQRLLIEAEEKKKRRTKEKIDTLAALVILQHYLDYLRLNPKK
ncbi:MAG TPA: Holliday junction resolvase RuvX, partial [bacterium]|nr:Holliday junction resolvase RuvX [bacterium]